MKRRQFISVIIPAYNAQPFIGDAIRSVLEQPDDVELIVVDDGSTDGTSDEVASFGKRVRLIRNRQNKGAPAALNRGLKTAQGNIIGFLDSDDIWSPDRLRQSVELITDMPDIAALWGQTRIVFLSQKNPHGVSSPAWPPQFFPSLGSLLVHRTVFDRIGLFDPTLRHAHDIDFLARAQEANLAFHKFDEIVQIWRRHATNMTNNVKLDRKYLTTAIRQALHRRRRTASSPKF